MKVKILLVAALGCVMLLSGCIDRGSSDNDSSHYSERTSSFNYVESSDVKSESSVVSSVENTEHSVPSLTLNSVTKQPDDTFDSVTLNFTLNGSLDDNVVYYLRVHWQNMMNGDDKIVYDKLFNKDETIIKCKNYGGENGYKIQLYTDMKEGKWSDELYYDTKSQYSDPVYTTPSVTETPKVHQYTHTFSAPDGYVFIPDYSDALEDINNGVQPDQFRVQVYFLCPGCGGKNILPDIYMDYSKNSWILCRMNCTRNHRCPYYGIGETARVDCYAVQVS